MKKNIIIATLCALCASAFGFSACGGDGDALSDFVGRMQSSADSAVTVDTKVTLEDEGVTVYTFTRRMEIDVQTRTASVADTKVTYTSNFEQKTESTTASVENVNGGTIVSLNLNESLVTAYEIKDGDMQCTVSKDKIGEVLKSGVSASTDMSLSVDFENGKMIKVSYSYKNSSSRTVNVTVTYGY